MIPQLFDRNALRRHRDRATSAPPGADFLFREVADRLADRLDDVTVHFPLALDIGARDGMLARALAGRGGIKSLIRLELSERLCRAGGGVAAVGEEDRLPFAPQRFNLVASNLALHWTQDLPGALAQIKRVLKPGGLFLASLFGGETLTELRQGLLAADAATSGGAAPRVSPFTDLRDAAGLLQRAGFDMPVADLDTIRVSYESSFRLMADLRAMGETNALAARPRHFARRALFAELAAQQPGRQTATFQVIYLSGWV